MNNSTILESPSQTIITNTEALKLLKQVSDPNAQLIRYYLQPFCDDLLGTLGSHRRLVIESKSPNDPKPKVQSFFVKSIPYEDPCETKYVKEKRVFEQECMFFADIAPLLKQHANLEPWAPECYLVKSDSLVFEDLKAQGYSMLGPLFDESTLKSALGALARLHASSILAESKLGKTFAELYPDAFWEMTYIGKGKTHGWCKTGIDAAVVVADSLGLDSSKITGLYETVLEDVKREKSKVTKIGERVISHGDLWANNMMFSGEHCRLVDFQFIRYAPAAQDLTLLLHLCASRELRQRNELYFIRFYHTNLCEAITKCKPKLEMPSFDKLLQDVERQRLRAVVSAAIYASSVFISRRFAAEIIDDPVEYQKFQYCDRRDKVFDLMRADEFYRTRVEDTVRDLVEFGQKL